MECQNFSHAFSHIHRVQNKIDGTICAQWFIRHFFIDISFYLVNKNLGHKSFLIRIEAVKQTLTSWFVSQPLIFCHCLIDRSFKAKIPAIDTSNRSVEKSSTVETESIPQITALFMLSADTIQTLYPIPITWIKSKPK